MFALTRPTTTSEPTQNVFIYLFFFFFLNFFTILRFFSLVIDIFGLKSFQIVYIENSKDIYAPIYGDRRVKLNRVKSFKRFDLKRV